MNLRERFIKYFTGEKNISAPFFHVFGPMPETVERWYSEGMKSSTDWFYEVGFEGYPEKQLGNLLPVNGFVCPEFEEKVLNYLKE